MLLGDYILVSLWAVNSLCPFLALLYIFTNDEGLCHLGGKAQNQGSDVPLGQYNGPRTAATPTAPRCLHLGPPGRPVPSPVIQSEATGSGYVTPQGDNQTNLENGTFRQLSQTLLKVGIMKKKTRGLF